MSSWFALQKTILLLLLPPSGILLIILFGFLIYKTIHRKTGGFVILSGIALLYLLSTSPVSNFLIRPLETDTPPFAMPEEKPIAIVVLTSGVKDLSHLKMAPQPTASSVSRMMQGIVILNSYPGIPLIICGGSGDPSRPNLSEAKALAGMAVASGIPEQDIVIEDRSANTKDGASEVKKLLEGKAGSIVLVTSAYHMDRSARFFREAGFSVIAAPTDYRSSNQTLSLWLLIPSAGNLETSSTALYEYLSRIRYGLLF